MQEDGYQRSEWYARSKPAAPTGSARGAAPKKKHTGMKVAALSLCVLLLIVASAYAFSDGFGRFRAESVPNGDGGASHSFTFEIPGGSGNGSGGSAEHGGDAEPGAPDAETEDGYEKDYKDFFSRYYGNSTVSKGEDSTIERTQPGGALRIGLDSAEGLAPMTLQQLYTACVDSVVGIKAKSVGQLGYYWGTGIVISEDGYILTNQHIIAGTGRASVLLPDGTEAAAKLVGEDTQTDIAVLKIEASGLHPAVFGKSGELSVGDSVVAIGNPLADSLSGTMTDGIISAIDRSVSNNGHPMTLLQTNAALNEGNSGGPLFNLYGQVVGITNMKMVNTYSDVTVEGIGFAIPSATAVAVANQLIATGTYVRPGIGITVGAVTEEVAAHYQIPDGLYISAVSAASDAAAKGVRVGDILTHVNGIEVRSTDDVLAIRDAMQIGDDMTLTLYREGETFDVVIRLDELGKLY